MTKLYSSLARVYHEMYQSIFDYRKEFRAYHRILKRNKCKNILEIGCGSGNLAPYFLKAGYNYTGLDLYKEMLAIAKEVEPKAKFVQSDMRKLKLGKKYDSIIISGRSFTYLTTNEDVMKTLVSIYKHLKKNGLLIFDNFRAEQIFKYFKKHNVQKARFEDKQYTRISENSWNLGTGWTWNWKATYKIREKGKTKTYKDKTILRAFTKSELKLFLELNKFNVEKTIVEGIGFTTIARKI